VLCATGEITAVCVTADAQGGMVAQPIPAEVRAQLVEAPPSAYEA
jgi:acyl-CoA thioesterase FadM